MSCRGRRAVPVVVVARVVLPKDHARRREGLGQPPDLTAVGELDLHLLEARTALARDRDTCDLMTVLLLVRAGAAGAPGLSTLPVASSGTAAGSVVTSHGVGTLNALRRPRTSATTSRARPSLIDQRAAISARWPSPSRSVT